MVSCQKGYAASAQIVLPVTNFPNIFAFARAPSIKPRGCMPEWARR